jgi:hypothetical protein
MADSSSIRRFREVPGRTRQCPPGLVLRQMADDSVDTATASMTRRHLEVCAYCREKLAMLLGFRLQEPSATPPWVYCREKLAMLQDFEARSKPRIDTIDAINTIDRIDKIKRVWPGPGDGVGIALLAASLVVAVGVGVRLRRNEGLEAEGPMIYRSAQFQALSPAGSVASAPPAFNWEPVEDAATYRLRLMDVDNTEIWSVETSATAVPVPAEVRQKMTSGTGFLWAVAARNRAGEKISETNLQQLYIRAAKQITHKEKEVNR